MSKAVEVQEYKTKNILLEHPADWYIDDQTFDAVQHSLSDIVNFYENQGNNGLQFASCGGAVYTRCKQKGLGIEIPTEWFLEDIRN